MCRLKGHLGAHFGVQEGEVSPCLQPRYAGSSTTPSPKGSALKNLDAENVNCVLDHFADVGKMVNKSSIFPVSRFSHYPLPLARRKARPLALAVYRFCVLNLHRHSPSHHLPHSLRNLHP